jgi:hypothetical protein
MVPARPRCILSIEVFTSIDDDEEGEAEGKKGSRYGLAVPEDGSADADPFGSSTLKNSPSMPVSLQEYALFENYPNPFNPSTTIRYHVPEASHVRLSIVNTLGRTIETLIDGEVEAGVHQSTWNAGATQGQPIPSGTYFYRMQARSLLTGKEFMDERLMLLLK